MLPDYNDLSKFILNQDSAVYEVQMFIPGYHEGLFSTMRPVPHRKIAPTCVASVISIATKIVRRD